MVEAKAGEAASGSDQGQDLSAIEPLLQQIRRQHGDDLKAILVYGSWLRGNTDTMLDFYVLTDANKSLPSAWQRLLCRALPPNVYQIHAGELRAKYALLSLKQFCNAMSDDFHSYFWARFAQPCDILYPPKHKLSDQVVPDHNMSDHNISDHNMPEHNLPDQDTQGEKTRNELEQAFEQAAATFIKRTLPMLPAQYSSRELWVKGLQLTYQCELRTESGQRADTLYDFNPHYYDQLTRQLAPSLEPSTSARQWAPLSWWLRRVQGKILSVLRLIKAAFTFNDPLQYLLWKVERHTGLHFEASQRQLKHPLIFGWPLLWRMYRHGAFR